MSPLSLWKYVRLVSCAAMLCLAGGATASAEVSFSDHGAATTETQTPITNSFSGYIIAVG
jgi:hypothetical protein